VIPSPNSILKTDQRDRCPSKNVAVPQAIIRFDHEKVSMGNIRSSAAVYPYEWLTGGVNVSHDENLAPR
jgi:hypothetical protein